MPRSVQARELGPECLVEKFSRVQAHANGEPDQKSSQPYGKRDARYSNGLRPNNPAEPCRPGPIRTVFLWTDATVARLRELHASGLSFSKITATLKGELPVRCSLSRNAVIGKAARLKLPRRVDPQTRTTPKVRQPRDRSDYFKAYNFARKASARSERVKAAESPESPAPPLPSLNIPLIDLQPHHCRFIPGDDRLFCAQPKVEGLPYCGYHAAIAYQTRRG